MRLLDDEIIEDQNSVLRGTSEHFILKRPWRLNSEAHDSQC